VLPLHNVPLLELKPLFCSCLHRFNLRCFNSHGADGVLVHYIHVSSKSHITGITGRQSVTICINRTWNIHFGRSVPLSSIMNASVRKDAVRLSLHLWNYEGHESHQAAVILPPRNDSAVYSGTVTFTASKPVQVAI
jgi:hypothetical protein